MEDKTVDFREGFALMRAYICTGSSDWLIGKDGDGPDLKLIKWVRKQALLIQHWLRNATQYSMNNIRSSLNLNLQLIEIEVPVS